MSINKSISETRDVFEIRDTYLKTQISEFLLFKTIGTEYIRTTLSVPPFGHPILHFNINNSDNFYALPKHDINSLLIGQLDRHVTLHPISGLELFVVNFKPYGFYNLFGQKPPSGKENYIEGKEIFGENCINELIKDLKACDNNENKCKLVESFILKNKNKNVKTNSFLDSIVDEIVKQNGLISISELINNKCSIRTIQRYFSEVIGISPKTFTRILRHKYIIQLIYDNPQTQWSDLVFRGFYFDHSHFTKDFQIFSKIKPYQYSFLKTSIVEDLIKR